MHEKYVRTRHGSMRAKVSCILGGGGGGAGRAEQKIRTVLAPSLHNQWLTLLKTLNTTNESPDPVEALRVLRKTATGC